MNIFELHSSIIQDYKSYLDSFINIRDEKVRALVDQEIKEGRFIKEPLIQFNPSYELGESLNDLAAQHLVHPDLPKVFGTYNLYFHQVEALKKGIKGESFVVTSGTGSGKSLTFLGTVFNHLFNHRQEKGITAILVYPMNALINSQEEEIMKYEINYLKSLVPGYHVSNQNSLKETIEELKTKTTHRFPVTYARYTGQENEEKRRAIQSDPPSIILTNYMMLELIMTRQSEGWLRESLKDSLKYLVFAELHTYRGRQGADVSMLIRRIKKRCSLPIVCIGTSATMASEGTVKERKEAVAEVASKIFDHPFRVENIIGESLTTCTSNQPINPRLVAESLRTPISIDDAPTLFLTHPLATWLETTIALEEEFYEGKSHWKRAQPTTFDQICQKLCEYTEEGDDLCRPVLNNLLRWAEKLNIEGARQTPRHSFLPYKIHQFISQTGNVYVTLDTRENRIATLQTARYLKVNQEDVFLYPVLFSRQSGHDFICVRKDFSNNKLLPRNPDELPEKITRDSLKADRKTGKPKTVLTVEDFPDGYLLLDFLNECIWKAEDEDYLPESWFRSIGGQDVLDNFYEFRVPQKIYFDQSGRYSDKPEYPLEGWFIPARLLLDPISGTIFDLKTSENTKLMRLGNEGRSTATTITSYNVVNSLHNQKVALKNQKLLSFTDNRQDASLQAGHFNDFLMVGRLRSAIYHALLDRPFHRLNLDEIAEKVFQKINLKEGEYARYPSDDPTWGNPENEKALKEYLLIRILYDLKRGWRFVTPNLEQAGLIQIHYNRLDEFCEREDFFQEVELFDILSPNERFSVFTQLLNYFRTSYAFDHYKLLRSRGETEDKIRNRLDPEKLWSLDEEEKIEIPYVLTARTVGDTPRNTYVASIGPASYFGKYLKKLLAEKEIDTSSWRKEDYQNYIERICNLLVDRNFLSSENIKGKRGTAKGYRLRLDNVIWTLGDEKTITSDDIRNLTYKGYEIKPNQFFQQFYKQDFNRFARTLEGREHTGQLSSNEREIRESEFKSGKLAALFCSPTMELGIDISELNIVHMRNVPPSPANYAQRSGRAGRSGQAALVFTYCSATSPHDRNYFAHNNQMVSGVVQPPKIDLLNEELLLTHLNAYLFMELGLHVVSSVSEVLDLNQNQYPIRQDFQLHIKDQITRFGSSWTLEMTVLFNKIEGVNDTYWYSDHWVSQQVEGFYNRFNHSFDRWRYMYRNAQKMIDNARLKIDDPTLKSDSPEKRIAQGEEKTGKRQREVLLNSSTNSRNSESEFYVFRYLAASGFLPGYGFTRLPVRVFLGHRNQDKGTYVSRSRFIGLREFGPQNLVYHNGGKYRIHKAELYGKDQVNQTIRISTHTGYAFLNEEGKGINNDPITNQPLKGDAVRIYNNLIELTESQGRPQERISSEEEERMSTGYDIEQFFTFKEGGKNIKRTTIQEAGEPLLDLIFDSSSTLTQINKKWRISTNNDGFAMGSVTGKWKKAREDEAPNPQDPTVNVRPFATNTADILYIQPVAALQLAEECVITLAYSIKRAIEMYFQIEEREIDVWLLGAGEQKNILLFESAEGSLGILSQIVDNATTLQNIFRTAAQILHFDPDTFEDTRTDIPKASYDDLLSYYNQRFHDKLDRFAVRPALQRLIKCQAGPQKGNRSHDEHFQSLLAASDPNSATEKTLLHYLYRNGYALPDRAQVNLPELYVSADFVYKTSNGYSLIFCDGSVHDGPEQRQQDEHKRKLCLNAGYDVIEWHYTEPVEVLVERRKDIFRKIV
jgi:superfamily II DNA helicase RecQ